MEPLGNELLRAAARLTRWATRHASFDVPFAQARLLALLDELGPARPASARWRRPTTAASRP
jgi:thioredoxin-like negative regulator of GroEL